MVVIVSEFLRIDLKGLSSKTKPLETIKTLIEHFSYLRGLLIRENCLLICVSNGFVNDEKHIKT